MISLNLSDQEMTDEEQFFWERVSQMPVSEAEQELVLRRERILLEIAMLNAEASRLKEAGNHEESRVLRAEVMNIGFTVALLNERIRYFRRVLHEQTWSKAIKHCLGQEAWDACRLWVVATEVKAVDRIEEKW